MLSWTLPVWPRGPPVLNNLGPDEPFGGVVGRQDPSDPATTGKIMQFKVVRGAAPTDASFNPPPQGHD